MNDAEHKHLARVKELGCIVCRNLNYTTRHNAPPCDAHHILSGGRRIDHYHTIPLCYWHHRSRKRTDIYVSLHGHRKEFERRYGTEQELLEQTRRELGETDKD